MREASGKPFLTLQFDAHENDAGAMTRCEAYLDSKGFSLVVEGRGPDEVESVGEEVAGVAPVAATASSRPSRTSVLKAAASTGRRRPTGTRYLLAAWICSIGFDAYVTSDWDERTLDLGGRATSGDQRDRKITLGDFLRIVEDEGCVTSPSSMPEANGPCRFGSTCT